MDPILTIIFVLVALVVGAILGWIASGRANAPLREENKRLREDGEATVSSMRVLLDEVSKERETAQLELSSLKASMTEKERGFEARQKELIKAKELMLAQFSKAGQDIFEAAQKKLLAGANEHLTKADEDNQKSLKALLQPVEITLKRYEENLSRVEKEREGSYRELNKAVSNLTEGNEIVRRETERLANVMRSSPKARGRWGEEQLRTILISAGLGENIDFSLQSTVKDGEKQLRPDCVINLPGDRCIIVDVKCPLVAFEQAYDEDDEERRAELLLQHANAMKSYANQLGRKGYWQQYDLSPDFVVMFIPGEHSLSAAAERAPDLIETAFSNGVIVASTINMLALAKVMAGMWRQEALTQQAQEIGEVGKELYKRLSKMGEHIAKLGRNLNLASGAYNDMIGSLESQVLTQAKRFEELQIDTSGKTIDTLPVADTAIRPLTKLTTTSESSEINETEEAAE